MINCNNVTICTFVNYTYQNTLPTTHVTSYVSRLMKLVGQTTL